MAPRTMRRVSILTLSRTVTLFGCSPASSEQHELFSAVLRKARDSDSKGRASLRKAIKRRKPNVYNAFMRDASNRGSISLVEEAVACMRRDCVEENAWTAAVRINAYSRVGRLEEAQKVLKEADRREIGPIGNAAIAPLVRCLMEPRFSIDKSTNEEHPVARIQEALQLVHARLSDNSVEPASYRTINTLLRGCKRWAPHLAPSLLSSFHRAEGHHPSSLALAAECACVVLDTTRAVGLLQEMVARGAPADAALLTEIAMAHALCGELREASTIFTRASEATASIESNGNCSNAGHFMRRGMPQELLRKHHSLLARFLQEDGCCAGMSEQGVLSSHLVSYPEYAKDCYGRIVSSSAQEHLHDLIHTNRRVCVEVGAGSGDWLIAQAAAHPQVVWIAVEPQLDRVHQIWSKVALNRLTNVHVCAMSAADVFGGEYGGRSNTTQGWLPEHSVDEVHMRFPYPVSFELPDLLAPKLPMNCGALGSGNFLDGALRVLRPRGALHIVTSEESYCALMLVLLRQHPAVLDRLVSRYGQAGFSRVPPVHRQFSKRSPPSTATELSFFDAALTAGGHMERYVLQFDQFENSDGNREF